MSSGRNGWNRWGRILPIAVFGLVFLLTADANALIDGVSGTTFNLVAKQDYIVTSDGDSFAMWGYALEGSRMQYPGPTLILTEGQSVTITLKNELPPQAGNVSLVFPGNRVFARGGVQGRLTREAPPDGATVVTYQFAVQDPGTYLYRSGTRLDLQVEMGLVGAMIVRPKMGEFYAYNHEDTRFDREFLYLITEMDPMIHRQVEYGHWNKIDTADYFATNWFVNGRNFPDLMADAFVPWLPTQPYNCQPRMHPGERVLLRMIGAGRDVHPMHLHGNDFETIAEDARLLSTGPGKGPDLAWKATTIRTVPGQTADAIWTWTGEKLGWDVYGHVPGDGSICLDVNGDGLDDMTFEYCKDHQVPFPVTLPSRDSLAFGPWYSGSPFLGTTGDLAPGDAGLNTTGGFFYMWHSHTEKELTSNDIWPGGLVTFMIVEPSDVPLP